MELWIGLDAEQCAARAGDFLASGPERNVIATVLDAARAGRYREAIFAVATGDRGVTVGVALRTPPHNLLAAGQLDEPGAFMEAWLGLDPSVSGVSAEPRLADALGRAWVRETGGHAAVRVQEALHVLERVTVPGRSVPGGLRPADWRESTQLSEWGIAFGIEAGIAHPQSAGVAIGYQLEQGRLYVWEIAGRPVALIGHTVTVAGSVRIGPVYTPVELRGRGYATAVTAALSQLLLDRGAERCLLYTDLANPVSNHIYAKIGYVRIADWHELTFLPGTAAPAS